MTVHDTERGSKLEVSIGSLGRPVEVQKIVVRGEEGPQENLPAHQLSSAGLAWAHWSSKHWSGVSVHQVFRTYATAVSSVGVRDALQWGWSYL